MADATLVAIPVCNAPQPISIAIISDENMNPSLVWSRAPGSIPPSLSFYPLAPSHTTNGNMQFIAYTLLSQGAYNAITDAFEERRVS